MSHYYLALGINLLIITTDRYSVFLASSIANGDIILEHASGIGSLNLLDVISVASENTFASCE